MASKFRLGQPDDAHQRAVFVHQSGGSGAAAAIFKKNLGAKMTVVEGGLLQCSIRLFESSAAMRATDGVCGHTSSSAAR